MPVYCQHNSEETRCRYCTTSVAWAIVKDGKGMKQTGHHRALSWARAALNLDDQPDVKATRNPHDPDEDVNVPSSDVHRR